MQTMRECARIMEINFEDGPFTCANPLAFADVVLVIGDNSGGVLQKAGANRTVSFAGGHGRLQLGAQACPGDNQLPMNIIFRVYSALMVLPLAETSFTAPVTIPNIAQSRSMLSNVIATQSDTERRILWYRMDRLHWMNVDGSNPVGLCDNSTNSVDTRNSMLATVAAAVHGRTFDGAADFRVKARCRLTEREGLFFVQNVVTDPNNVIGTPTAVLSYTRDLYLRFAVK